MLLIDQQQISTNEIKAPDCAGNDVLYFQCINHSIEKIRQETRFPKFAIRFCYNTHLTCIHGFPARVKGAMIHVQPFPEKKCGCSQGRCDSHCTGMGSGTGTGTNQKVQYCAEMFTETGTGTGRRTHCFLLCQYRSFYSSRSRSHAV